MPKITMKIPVEMRAFVQHLSKKEKIELFEMLKHETRRDRWEALISRIRKRVAKYPISGKEIDRICKEVRRERNGASPKSRR